MENGIEIRKKLAKKKIYIPKLWPNILNENLEDTFLESITTLDNIPFEPGLCILENIHALYFIFKEKPVSLHKTKHLRLTHNKTKRKTT